MTTDRPRRLVIGISGASGTVYGIRMLELLRGTGIETHLVMSKSAEMTMAYETDLKPKEVRELAGVIHDRGRGDGETGLESPLNRQPMFGGTRMSALHEFCHRHHDSKQQAFYTATCNF